MNLKDYIVLIRPLNCVMMFLAVLIGSIIESNSIKIYGLIGGCCAFLIGAGGNVVNDYFDIKIDKINAPHRPLARESISKKSALIYSIILFLSGLILSYFINIPCFIIASFNSFLLVMYAKSLKKTELIGNISIAYLMSSLFIFGGFTVESTKIVFYLALCAFFAGVGREIAKDVADVEGDKKDGAGTLPIKRGEKFSAKIAIVSILIAVVISPLPAILGYLNILYILSVNGANILFILVIFEFYKDPSPKNAEKIELKLKLAMLLALVAFVLGIITI